MRCCCQCITCSVGPRKRTFIEVCKWKTAFLLVPARVRVMSRPTCKAFQKMLFVLLVCKGLRLIWLVLSMRGVGAHAMTSRIFVWGSNMSVVLPSNGSSFEGTCSLTFGSPLASYDCACFLWGYLLSISKACSGWWRIPGPSARSPNLSLSRSY